MGKGRISIDARVKVLEGAGKARLRFRWNGKGVAGALCPDLDVTREVEGALVPLTFHLRGSVGFRLEGDALVIDPSWPEQTFRLRLRPSTEAWKTVLQVIDEQPGACRVALRTVNVVDSLRALIEKGFVVHVHTAAPEDGAGPARAHRHGPVRAGPPPVHRVSDDALARRRARLVRLPLRRVAHALSARAPSAAGATR